MERVYAHCPHEHLAFSMLSWTDDAEPFDSMSVVSCALCDLMFCSVPDYVFLASMN